MSASDEHQPQRPGHLDLLRVARSVQVAAVEGDVDALHDEVCRLRNALVAHIRHEQTVDDVADVHHRLSRHGHERLLRFVDEVLASTPGGDDGCSCLLRAAELRALLIRQLRLESRAAGVPS